MDRVLVFDICSMCILIVLFISILLHKMIKGKTNNTYVFLVILVFFSAFLNVSRVCISRYWSHTQFSQVVFKIICTIYLMVRNLTMPAFILYIYALSGKWYRLKSSKKHYITLLFITSGIFVITSFGFFSNFLFTISPELEYERGPLLNLAFLFSAIAMLYAFILIWCYGKVLEKNKYLSLNYIVLISTFGVIIQFFFPYINIEIISTAIPLLFIFLFIQRPVENIDDASNCLNYYAFLDEIQKSEKLNEELNIILIKITNYRLIQKRLSEKNIQRLLSQISSGIYKLRKNPETELYYLNSYMFAITADSSSRNKIRELANRCCDFLRSIKEVDEDSINLIFKMCVINYPKDISSSKDLISFTNTFTTCITSVNCVTTFEEEAKSQDFMIKYELNDIINKGISEKKFKIYYQPIYNVHSKKFESAEALIRLRDEKYDFIPPSLFIPAAEASGAIHSIGEFVVTDVYRFIRENKIAELNLKYIELNLSIAQCVETNLVSKMKKWMSDYGISADQVNLELTESIESYNSGIFLKNIENLSELGLSFSLDDFGTGYSNIERILNLPVEIIKFDKAFADEYKNPEMSIITKETICMLHKIGKKVLIEGIENEETLKVFVDYGVDFVQGYYFSKPLPEKDFINFLRKQNGGKNGLD